MSRPAPEIVFQGTFPLRRVLGPLARLLRAIAWRRTDPAGWLRFYERRRLARPEEAGVTSA